METDDHQVAHFPSPFVHHVSQPIQVVDAQQKRWPLNHTIILASLFSEFITLRERCFLSCHQCGTKKKFWVPFRNWISDHALMLYHWATETLQWTRSITKSIFSCLPKLTPWHVVKQGYISKCSIPIESTWLCAQKIFCMVDFSLDRNLLGW